MSESRRGFHVSYEKALLWLVIASIWGSVWGLQSLMPRQSVPFVLVCLMAMYLVVSYLATLHHRRKQARNPDQTSLRADYRPSVSVVVPAHNEAAVIADTVANLMALDYPDFDLWVLDDRSTDETAAVLNTLTQRYPSDRFHVVVRVPDATPGKSAVLNDALSLSHGDVLAVFDADARVSPDFLTRALPALAESGVGAVQVRKTILNAAVNLLTRCQHYEYQVDAHMQASRDVIQGAVELRGNGQLVKRTALVSIGGWNEDTITDDLDLSTRLHIGGWDIRFVADATVAEEGIVRFKPLLRQRRRWAEGSLKRYLEYVVDMMLSPHASYRARFDMLAYFIEFAFPIWVVADSFFQVVNLFTGHWPSHLLMSFAMMPVFAFFFLSTCFVALRHFEKQSIGASAWHALETGTYMLVVWVPVVTWITIKVLFGKDAGPLNWGKTEHLGTQAFVRVSRFQKLHELLANLRRLPLEW